MTQSSSTRIGSGAARGTMLAAMKMAEPTIVLNVMRLTSQVPRARTSLGAGGGVVELRWLSWFFGAADAAQYSKQESHSDYREDWFLHVRGSQVHRLV